MTISSFDTRYGTIFHCSVCKDDFKNIETSGRYRKASGTIPWRKRANAITLQRPALASFKQAEAKLGREIVLTGSIRTCALQASLYRSDPNRFASPNVTLHTQGLAIDVTTEDPELTTKVRKQLEECGWNQARPSDEPWHFSFRLTA